MSPSTGQEAIIYIDSDEDDQLLIGSLFNTIAPERPVHYFDRAEAALTYLKQTDQQPFIILCEILLPGMTGLELRQVIQDDDALRKRCIPFVFMSNPVVPTVIEQAFELTVQGIFEKKDSRKQQEQELALIFRYWQTSFHPNKI